MCRSTGGRVAARSGTRAGPGAGGRYCRAAGVSARTYNNYYPSREHAIVAAVTAERAERLAAAMLARRAGVRLSTVVADAIVEQYTDAGERARDALLLITTHPGLRRTFVDTARAIEAPLADAIARRVGGIEELTAQVLAASVAAAVRVALRQWLRSFDSGGLVVVSDPLADPLRAALAPLSPALDAAEQLVGK